METNYKVGDKVRCRGWGVFEIWKISEKGIHAFKMSGNEKHYIVFHFNPTHHTQTAVSEIYLVS